MTTFLTLNGVAVPCSVEQGVTDNVDQVGAATRALDGTMRVHRRVTKNKYKFATTPQLAATALAFRDLVLGKGHYWTFDASLYSSKGLGPSATTGSTPTQSAGSAFLGAGKMSMPAGSTISFVPLPLLSGGPWTVIVSRNVNGAGWNQTIANGLSSIWTNGVLTGSASWLHVTPATGLVKIDADASHVTTVDELIVLPYNVPSDWPAQIYALMGTNSTQWAPLAQLLAGGDAIEGGARSLNVMGTIGSLKGVPANVSGGFKANNLSLDFTLEEI